MPSTVTSPRAQLEGLKNAAHTARHLGGTLTDEIWTRAMKLADEGVPVKDLAAALGVHQTTVYKHRRMVTPAAPFRPVVVASGAGPMMPSCGHRDDAAQRPIATARFKFPRGTRLELPIDALTPEIAAVLLRHEWGA